MPRIFLSPSTQEFNLYLTEGSEEFWMNLIADAMEPYLLASGISFTRNDPDKPLSDAIAQSNAGSYDLHLALHSNASPESLAGKLRGVDAYYQEGSARGRRAAVTLSDNIKQIILCPNVSKRWPPRRLPSSRGPGRPPCSWSSGITTTCRTRPGFGRTSCPLRKIWCRG